MIKLKINHAEIEVPAGTTLLKAAEKLGFEIPTMCHNDEVEHFTSCMICLVKNNLNGKLLPSCSVKAEEGMDITTLNDEISEARQTALELLLSDHVGDCEAPCTMACPAHMDIPTMNRLLAAGQFNEALKVVKQNIALPSVLGQICPAPCEGVCRRKPIDGAVSICLLKRYAGDFGELDEKPAPASGKKVAIIGAGPAGLAAAYHLQLNGIQCTVFEKTDKAGGIILNDVENGKLNPESLEKESLVIGQLGAEFKLNTTIKKNEFKKLQEDFDAVLIASGELSEEQKSWGISTNEKGFEAQSQTYQTENPKIFVAGSALKPAKLVIRLLAQGKEAAASIHQFLNHRKVVGQPLKFNSKFGKLVMEEYAHYLKEANDLHRIEPAQGIKTGLSEEEVKAEAARCMHCDCRKISSCKLRDYSDEYAAVQKRFYYDERKPVRKQFHSAIVYEPEKCIKCGICVRLTEKYREEFGFTYIGRGFDVEIGIPFNENLDEGLKKVAEKVADACPTGALARK
ncbi:FAD-dependent oxidoreductase [Roseimarinus sediminis]|uniref:FAD-dependent oxidoreductase n=1 Tax=Roseimarinus sediminis TaxID=1610899 RepID=UPI003D21E7E4